MYFSVFIPGDPIPQPRPRITVRGRHAVAYVPRDHAIHEWRAKVREWIKLLVPPWKSFPVSGVGLRVLMEFRLRKPKSNKTLLPIGRPDLDNLAKAVLDAGTGVIWRDDSQVTEMLIRKHWGSMSGLYLEISDDDQ